LQDFTFEGESESIPAHVGPPSINVEAKLVGVDDDKIENGGDPTGLLLIRGPSVGKMGNDHHEDYIQVPSAEKDEKDEGWINTEFRATVQPNGSFVLS